MSDAFVVVSEASKAFVGVQALDRVNLSVGRGQIHALLGENGAGKSTLIKILTGVHQPDAGEVRLDGRPVRFRNPREAIGAGIGAVHQERNLITRFSIAENITLENPPRRFGMFDAAAAANATAKWLKLLGLELNPGTPVVRLSVAQMQLVEIAKALSLESRFLVLDEPTSSLTPHETRALFTVLRRLAQDGVAILFVSHKLEEVFELCSHVTVLRDGRNACASQPLAGLTRGDIVRLMIGREEAVFAAAPPASLGAAPALELRGVATALGHRDISLAVRGGEILGLYGLVGAGRSELARAVIGAARITGGEVLVQGRRARIRDVTAAVRRFGIGYVSEDRKGEGLILQLSVATNIAAAIWHRLARLLGFLTRRMQDAAATPFVRALDIRTPSLAQRVANLSGGNQQKVSVAKWLAAKSRILIVDEPTVGIDIRSKAFLHELLLRLARDGTAVLLISSDMPELIALADRIAVMKEFQVIDSFDNTRDYAAASARIMQAIHG
ncbi:MAG: sugar ABC transporter ATP-binding protein [Alphaproteobacteria bacterium]|nr:sugar ABC transporter ATP-binding protein [Alphaproteobacteria bacterium]